ncbi:MAG: flagellin FliC [Pseudobdellovibrio sp.]|nr:flagellin FliC [Pseudobdellovibrio sp.]
MGLRIATNVAAINAGKNLYSLGIKQNTSMARLSSGSRINQAADDAAGLAISENIKAQVRGLRQANRNANDGISLVQVAEGSLGEMANMLVRLRELGVQAASDTISDKERMLTNVEYQQLKAEMERIAQSTKFNGTPLLNGQGGVLDIQIGTQNDPSLDRISFRSDESNATLEALQIVDANVADKLSAQNSLAAVDNAIAQVNSSRANLGAFQNRLQSTSQNLATAEENYAAANSRIRDADIAAESTDLAKNNVLMQAATSVLGQANTQTQLALKLLG